MTHCFGSFCRASRPCPSVTLEMPKPNVIVRTAIQTLLRFVDATTFHLAAERCTQLTNQAILFRIPFCNRVIRSRVLCPTGKGTEHKRHKADTKSTKRTSYSVFCNYSDQLDVMVKHKDTETRRPQKKAGEQRSFDAGFLCGLRVSVSLCLTTTPRKVLNSYESFRS